MALRFILIQVSEIFSNLPRYFFFFFKNLYLLDPIIHRAFQKKHVYIEENTTWSMFGKPRNIFPALKWTAVSNEEKIPAVRFNMDPIYIYI